MKDVNHQFMEPLINVHQVKKSFSFLFVVGHTKFLTVPTDLENGRLKKQSSQHKTKKKKHD